MKTPKNEPPFIRSAYNYDMNAASDATGLACNDKSLTQQEFAEETNINYIADRYGLTGELPTVVRTPTYGDFTGIFDFQTAQNAVRTAIEDFMQLPAKLRSRFDNNPQKLLTFLEDPENLEEARALGLVNKAPAPIEATPDAKVTLEPAKDPKGKAKPKGDTPDTPDNND